MCMFFSAVSDGKGKVYYFDSKLRAKCKSKELNYEPDSHTSIADYFGFKGEAEDKLNKYEYNPLTKEFTIDQLNTTNDSQEVERVYKGLNFKKIVPELIVKPIVNPFELPEVKKVTKQDILNLKKWANVEDSVWDSVWDSVGGSVRDSVWDSVWDSVRDSVWDSVEDSVWAYISTFFNIPKWKGIKHKKGDNPFAIILKLWDKGLVPSFDGTTWRLHTGKKAKIIFEITEDELKKYK
jgi:hypothetical protein